MNVESLIMYLRKSRSDNPSESVEEVLFKHYTILQDFCVREFGEKIPEKNIYREVVSGESIADRIEIKKVLSRIENEDIAGIVVVEPQRLSRGDLVDCGNLINILQYTHTPVITPTITYNLEKKMERRFFQDELMRGRDYLEYTKEILMRGKLAAIKRGCFLQAVPPYGYDKIKIGKDNTLAPNSDADTVRMIFDLYAKRNMTSWEICKELQRLGIKSPRGSDAWAQATVDKILKNHHYIGKVTYQRDKTEILMENGQKIAKRKRQNDFIIAEGKHPAIISPEIFNQAQSRIASRPPVKSTAVLKNAFAGLIYCEKCGHLMIYKEKGGERNYIVCKTKGCSKAIKYSVISKAIISALEKSELPKLSAKYSNTADDGAAVQKNLIKKLEKELQDMKAQEETQYELLETKKYTQALFDRRNKILREKMQSTEKKIAEARRTMPKAIDYGERIAALTAAIQTLKDETAPECEKNSLLKSIISRIDCKSNQTLKNCEYDFSLKITLLI